MLGNQFLLSDNYLNSLRHIFLRRVFHLLPTFHKLRGLRKHHYPMLIIFIFSSFNSFW